MPPKRDASLILADGSHFRGRSVGADGTSGGEVVFNTSLSGYQEVLTDPSYRGQIVLMTNPLIGNYGVNTLDEESQRPWLAGFLMRQMSPLASNHRAESELGEYLRRHDIVAIDGIDTRSVVRRIREQGAMKALVTTETHELGRLREMLAEVPDLEGRDLVAEVGRGGRYEWTSGMDGQTVEIGRNRPRVVVIDHGTKNNILRNLVDQGFRVIVLPSKATAQEVLAEEPQGVLVSNGPGDPRVLEYAAETVRGLLGKVPLFGICLGHQILAAAIGAKLYKLKFGHHGGNQPVKDLRTGAVEITAQNHGFAVDRASLEAAGAVVTHLHLNDDTVAGMALPERCAMSVQYHPEAGPGPRDSQHLFSRFRQLVREGVQGVV